MQLTQTREIAVPVRGSRAAPAKLKPLLLQATIWAALIAAAVLLGAIGSGVGELAIAALALAIVGAAVALAYPSLALVALLVLSFGMLPAILVPGALQSQMRNLIEVGLIGLCALMATRAFLDDRIRISDLLMPWALFLASWGLLWIVAFIRGYFIEHYTLAIPDARKHFGWCMIVVAAVVERQRPWRLHHIVVAIASILSFELLLQAASGRMILTQLYDFKAEASEGSSVPRGVTWGAEYLMMYTVYYLVQRLTVSREPGGLTRLLPLVLLNVGGLLCTFTRGIWVASLAGLVFLVIFGGGMRTRLALRLGIAALIAVVALLGLAASGNKIADAVIGRAFSIKQEGARGTSLGARYDENRQALEPIADNFLFGIGHGGEYKKYLNPERKFVEQAIYIHNGYLYIQIKYGVLGTLTLVLLLGLVIRVSASVRKRIPPENAWYWRSQAGMGCAFAFAVNAVSSPVWVEFGPTIGLACALTHMAAARAHALEAPPDAFLPGSSAAAEGPGDEAGSTAESPPSMAGGTA